MFSVDCSGAGSFWELREGSLVCDIFICLGVGVPGRGEEVGGGESVDKVLFLPPEGAPERGGVVTKKLDNRVCTGVTGGVSLLLCDI